MNKITENFNKYIILIKQLISFGFVGSIITTLSLIIYWACVYIGIHYQAANAIGFLITVAIAYVLNNRITFKDNSGAEWSIKALAKTYISYSITGLFMASILLWLWTQILGIAEGLAPILNLFFTIPINFLLNKFWVYKKINSDRD